MIKTGIVREPRRVKALLLFTAGVFLSVFIILPMVTIFREALKAGVAGYLKSFVDPGVAFSIRLSLLTVLICVPVNTFFGVVLAWLVTKYEFPGKKLLITVVEVPFSVSPVIAGLLFIFLFGSFGWFGTWLTDHNIKIVFAVPGIVLATLFVSFPFVARELTPLMRELGKDDEEAALTLGASGLQIFWKVTLPNIKWGLLYGIILTNARAMGEFGAVSVVSGLVRGVTTTMPLYIDILYGEYMFKSAFAVASLLTFLAVVTIIVKAVLEYAIAVQRKSGEVQI
ncbi:MAG: sulfate ABC transporter permease subunit CysW [Chitinispirillales bacterium]|nr:sulfate ABC transporter permease subunit CysW [Chitinispirillales bacterium]